MKRILIVLAVMVYGTAVAGPLQGPHKHGSLEVAITNDEEFLIFRMLMTSQDLLGFEDSPTTDKKKALVETQYEKLYREETLPNLFRFVPADACTAFSADMTSDMLDYHEHDNDEDKVQKHEKDIHSVGDEDGHSDFLLNYVFKCKDTELIQMTFHEVFPSIKQVNYYANGELVGEPVVTVEAEDAVIAGPAKETDTPKQ